MIRLPIAALLLARVVPFEPGVINLEHERAWLSPAGPPGALLPAGSGALWYGRIHRTLRAPADSHPMDASVPFAVEYAGGAAARAWCDLDLDDDLSDESPIALARYPGAGERRSFLARISWVAAWSGRSHPIDWTIRVVLEPGSDEAAPGAPPPAYRIQRVHGRTGTLEMAGRRHLAVLFDGNGDGLYTREFADGFFVDLDDDRHIEVDPRAPEFAPMGAPFALAGRALEVESVEPVGERLTLRDLGPAPPAPSAPAAGAPAPGFETRDSRGAPLRLSDRRGGWTLLWFWSSRCPTCERQAPALKRIASRFAPAGVSVIGISYDVDREAMEAFVSRHDLGWPNTFSGRRAWEDPVGRLYRESATGPIYLIDPAGVLEGTYTIPAELEARLESLAKK